MLTRTNSTSPSAASRSTMISCGRRSLPSSPANCDRPELPTLPVRRRDVSPKCSSASGLGSMAIRPIVRTETFVDPSAAASPWEERRNREATLGFGFSSRDTSFGFHSRNTFEGIKTAYSFPSRDEDGLLFQEGLSPGHPVPPRQQLPGQHAASSEPAGTGAWASWLRLLCLLIGWLVCSASWAMGAFVQPTLEVNVMEGTRFARSFQRSLLRALVDLAHHRMWLSLCVLGLFSVVVPLVKLACTLWLIWKMSSSPLREVLRQHGRMLWVLTRLASYQLLDLYMGVIFISFFNSDSVEAELLTGFYWFFYYCVTSLVCSEVLAGAFTQVQVEEGGAQGAVNEIPRGDSADDLTLLCGACLTPSRTRLLPEAPHKTALPKCIRHSAGQWSVTESMAVCLLSASLALLLGASALTNQPLLEVRSLWSGIVVDRSSHSALDVLRFLPRVVKGEVVTVLVLLNVVLPLLYVLALLVAVASSRQGNVEGTDGARAASGASCTLPAQEGARLKAKLGEAAAEHLRPYATTDVFVLAFLLFLLTMQDAHTLTLTPEGSEFSFSAFLGAGLTFFILRWLFPLAGGATTTSHSHSSKVVPPIIAWGLLLYLLIFKGLPGATPERVFPTLDSICEQTLPVVDQAVSLGIPAAFGDCQNPEARPPQPCKGDGLLLNTTTEDGFIEAIWMGGLDTLKMDRCRLWRDDPVVNSSLQREDITTTTYHLTVEGVFKHLGLFLHLKQCGPFGCTHMNSADHCCGDDIRFRLTFAMYCRSSKGVQAAFRDIGIEGCDIDPMLIRKRVLDHSWIHLAVDAVDISPQVEGVAKELIHNFMGAARIFWAKKQMRITEWLNLIVAYNSPGTAGSC